jgi:hypothetical protein
MKSGILAFTLVLLFMVACAKEPMEFHKLDIPPDKFSNSDPKSPTLQEFYVVSHPSESMDSLASQALSFCRQQEPSRPESTYSVGRAFIRETRQTPRDFVERDIDGGSIRTHGEDWLLDITHVRTQVRDCWFVSIQGRQGSSPLDTCVELAPTSTPPDSTDSNP